MNDDASKANGKRIGDPAGTAQELFESLLEQYDLASAEGQTPRVLDDTRLPDELRDELASLGRFVAELNAATCQRRLTMLDRDAELEPALGDELATTPADAQDLLVEPQGRSDESLVGEQIGRFLIVRELGRGGGGVVFLAHDPSIDREVALKLPRPEALVTPELRCRFMREAQAAGRLDHPHVMTVHEVGEDGALCYLVSPYCRGPSLALWLSNHEARVGARDAAQLVACLADGLEHSHGLGVLHRDIKPANVLLDVSATEQHTADQELVAHPLSSFVPKLTDFGLAKLSQGAGDETRTRILLGTPAYMAPEQADVRREQRDGAADIYGLGAILYELLTHRPPFRGRTDAEILQQVLHEEPVWPSTLWPDLPCDLEAICLKCLAKDPGERYASAGALAADLRRFLDGKPTLARPLTAVHRLVSWTRRRPALAGLIAVSLVAAIALVGMAVAYTRHLRDSRATAQMLRADAETSKAIAQQQAYAATMRTAQWAWQTSNLRVFRDLLASYGQSELRGFEWHYLQHLSRRGRIRLHPQQPIEVDGVAFAPDGKRVATANRNGMIDIWSHPGGERLRSFRAHDVCANLLRYSPNGRLLATASCDATIRLWDAESLELVREIRSPGGPIRTFQFDPKGEKIYGAGDEVQVRVWNVANGEQLGVFEAGPDALQCLALNEDGSMLAAGGPGHKIFVWETETSALLTEIPNAARITLALQFVGGKPLLAISEPPNLVSILSVPEGQHYHSFTVHSQARCFAVPPDASQLFCATDDGIVDIFDLDRREVTATIPLHLARVSDIAVSPDGRHLVTSSLDHTAVILGLGESNPTEPFERVVLPDGNIRAVVLNVQAAKLAIAVNDDERNSVFVRDVGGGQREIQLPRQTSWPVDQMYSSFDGHYLSLVNNADHDLNEIWRITGTHPVLVQIGQQIQSIASAEPRDYYQIRIMDSNILRVINARSGDVVSNGRLDANPHGLDFRPGKQWIVSLVGNTVTVWDVHAQRMLQPFSAPRWTNVADLSPGAKLLVVGSDAGAHLFEFPSGAPMHDLVGHEGRVTAASFAPDSKTLATGGEDQTIRLWNVATGQEMLTLTGHSAPVVGLAFSKDGKTLTSLARIPSGAAPVEVFRWRAR